MSVREEYGTIPYIKKNNSYRFVIVTKRHHAKKWIFPKGQPEADKSAKEIAVNEAYEEAGVIGTIKGKAVKIELKKSRETVVYKLYPLRVSKVCRNWPERKTRKRKFIKPSKALSKLVSKPYAEALSIFLNR